MTTLSDSRIHKTANLNKFQMSRFQLSDIWQILLLILIILLPIQTPLQKFLVQSLPLPTFISYWKEIIVGLMILLSIVDFSFKVTKNNFQLISKTSRILLWATLFLVIYSFVQSLLFFQIPLAIYILGFRFELWWLLLFTVSWVYVETFSTNQTTNFKKSREHFWLLKRWFNPALITGYLLLTAFVIATLKIGQDQVYNYLQFNTNNSQIAPKICDVIDYSENSCRLSGGFGSPNHFAGYLLLILPVLIINLWKSISIFRHNSQQHNYLEVAGNLGNTARICFFGILVSLNLFFLYNSYSRFALLGLLIILGGTSVILIAKSRNFLLADFRKSENKSSVLNTSKLSNKILGWLFALILLVPIGIGIVAINLPESVLTQLPTSISKPSSTFFHSRRTSATLQILSNNPARIITGYGLAMSGSAAKLEYYNIKAFPIFGQNEAVAYENGLVGEDLTIPESWFLQILLNGGLFYAIIYCGLLFFPLLPIYNLLKGLFGNLGILQEAKARAILSLGLFAILVGNLFLHLFESQVVALYWTMLVIYSNISLEELINN